MTLAVMPVGVLTAVYLHEYAPSELAAGRGGAGGRGQPGRRALHRLRPLRPGLLHPLRRAAAWTGCWATQELHWGQPGILWASLTLAVLTLPVVIVSTEEALRAVPHGPPHGEPGAGGHPVPDAGAGGAAGRAAGHPHRRRAGGLPRRGRGGAHPLHRRRLLPPRPARQAQLPVHAPGLPHLRAGHAVARTWRPPGPLLYATVLVLLALTFALNLVAVLIRARTRRRASASH